ncbi:MAG: PQQ-dependent sugar dehydrogenase, partial [Flavitalea sp.]
MLKKLLIACTVFISAYAIPPVFEANEADEHNQRIQLVTPDTISYIIDTLASNLIVPWELIFLPDKSILITERAGRIRLFRNDTLVIRPVFEIPGIPLD